MEKKAKPGNPNILEASMATRWPALSPGEKTKRIGIRLPESLVGRLEAMEGSKSDNVRKAIEQYLENSGY
jgi:hypothetical protein